MIQDARSANADWAADNLQRFIDGEGGTVSVPPEKIKSFSKVQDGIERIKKNTRDKQLQRQTGNFILDGDKLYSSDYWIADIKDYSPFSELSYASGASKIHATSTINMTKSGDIFTGTGVIDMKWYDVYDWNAGQSFPIPSKREIVKIVNDNDGIYLKQYGGAKDFDMESNFSLEFNGTYDPKSKKWTSIKWK